MKVIEFVPAGMKLEGREPYETPIQAKEDALNADWIQRVKTRKYDIRGNSVFGRIKGVWKKIATIDSQIT